MFDYKNYLFKNGGVEIQHQEHRVSYKSNFTVTSPVGLWAAVLPCWVPEVCSLLQLWWSRLQSSTKSTDGHILNGNKYSKKLLLNIQESLLNLSSCVQLKNSLVMFFTQLYSPQENMSSFSSFQQNRKEPINMFITFTFVNWIWSVGWIKIKIKITEQSSTKLGGRMEHEPRKNPLNVGARNLKKPL